MRWEGRAERRGRGGGEGEEGRRREERRYKEDQLPAEETRKIIPPTVETRIVLFAVDTPPIFKSAKRRGKNEARDCYKRKRDWVGVGKRETDMRREDVP